MEMGRFMSRKAGKGSLVRPAFLNDEAARVISPRNLACRWMVTVSSAVSVPSRDPCIQMFSTRMVPVTSTVVFFSTTILRAEMEPEMCWSVLILQTPRHRKSPEALPYKTRSRHSMFSPFRSALACTVTLPQVCTLVRCVLLCKMTSSSLIYAEQWPHLAETAVAGTEVLLRQEKHSTSRAGAGLLSAVGGSVQGGAGEGWLIFPEGAVLIRGMGWKVGFMEQRGRQKNEPFFCRP